MPYSAAKMQTIHIPLPDGGPAIAVGPGQPLLLIAGPCVLESAELAMQVAATLKATTSRLGIPFIFKSSFDKANRTAIDSFRGPGLTRGLEILAQIHDELKVPIVSDVHEVEQVPRVAEVLDIIQIPAFLCRQTDLLLAAARTNKPINLKKGQFMAPWDMKNAVDKIFATGNRQLLLTERGITLGYNNLVVDMRSLPIMRSFGCPVIYDATHSVQMPGGAGTSSSGQRQFIPPLARAAVAVGVDGIFMEVHPNPSQALCDGPNSLALDEVEPLLASLLRIRAAAGNEN